MQISTSFTELVGCELPLQLAGMGGLSTVALAAAVSNAGGLGMIALPTATPDQLAESLAALEAETSQPFGVTFIVPFLNPACIPVAAEYADVIEFSFGSPDAAHIAAAHSHDRVVGWQVGTAAEARDAVERGVDFVIAQGTEAGGHHVAAQPLSAALEAICAAVDVPVVAAGGIGTAEDVGNALGVGAAAVRIGTRFTVATEADIHDDYAAALISSRAGDTSIADDFDVFWPDTPHRVLTSSVTAVRAAHGDVVGRIGAAGVEMDVPIRAPMLAASAFVGNVAATPMYAGTSVDHATARIPAADIVQELTVDL